MLCSVICVACAQRAVLLAFCLAAARLAGAALGACVSLGLAACLGGSGVDFFFCLAGLGRPGPGRSGGRGGGGGVERWGRSVGVGIGFGSRKASRVGAETAWENVGGRCSFCLAFVGPLGRANAWKNVCCH